MTETVVFDNRITVVMEEIPFVHSVCFGIWVANGSRHEPSEVNGISHFIEHMLFKGTENNSAMDIADKMDAVGGQINAFTSKEYTCYYTRTLSSHFDIALEVISDMLFNSLFDSKDIVKERNVIMEEISMYEDSPEETAHDLLQYNVWQHDSLGYPILGTREKISTFDTDTFTDYYSKNYCPENMVISLAGNIDKEKMLEKIQKIFGSFKRENPRVIQEFNTTYNKSITIKEKEIEQLHMIFSFPGIGLGDKDAYTLAILNTIFGGGMSSRLFQSVREDNGLAYSVYSYSSAYKDAGLFSIYAGLNKSQCQPLIKTVIGEIKSLYTNKITQDKLERTKEQLKSNYILSLESTTSRMNAAGKSQLLLGYIMTPEMIIQKIEKITIDKVYQMIDRIFQMDKISVCAVGNVQGLSLQEMVESEI